MVQPSFPWGCIERLVELTMCLVPNLSSASLCQGSGRAQTVGQHLGQSSAYSAQGPWPVVMALPSRVLPAPSLPGLLSRAHFSSKQGAYFLLAHLFPFYYPAKGRGNICYSLIFFISECHHSARVRNWNVSFPVLPDSCNVFSVYYWMQYIPLNTLSVTFSEKSLAKFCKSFPVLRLTLLMT